MQNVQIQPISAPKKGLSVVETNLAELGKIFILLPEDEQEALLRVLRKRALMAQAEALSAAVKPNSITLEEIVEEVLKVRAARA